MRSGERRRRWRRGGRDPRFGASVGGLDPGERANDVLGDHGQLSEGHLFFLGRG